MVFHTNHLSPLASCTHSQVQETEHSLQQLVTARAAAEADAHAAEAAAQEATAFTQSRFTTVQQDCERLLQEVAALAQQRDVLVAEIDRERAEWQRQQKV